MMFDVKNLYPTPPHLIEVMTAKINGHPRRILEPSAGKGDLVAGVRSKYDRYHTPDISVIEIDPTLQATLRGQGLTVLDSDFLSYSGPDKFDLIIANPPFDAGDRHLLKMIDITYRGQIICLLNAETLKNPCTNFRKLLVQRLGELDAEIEYHQGAFADAERKTDVEIALVNIVIRRQVEDDLFAGCTTTEEVSIDVEEKNEVSTGKNIRELVAEYNELVEIGTETIREFYRNHRKIGEYLSLRNNLERQEAEATPVGGNDLTSWMLGHLNTLLAQLRKKFWRRVLDLEEVRKRLTKKKQDEFEAALGQQCKMDFTESNVRQFALNIIGGYERTLSDAVVEIFDKMTKDHHYRDSETCKNVHYFNGWKSNSAFRVNRKVVVPGADWMRSFWNEIFNRWEIGWDTKRLLRDIDTVMNYFDGMNTYVSIVDALEKSFAEKSRWDRQSGIQSTYFTITVHKKGTIHLTFRDPDLLRRFNIVACKGKNWLPEDYGAREFSKLNPEEKAVATAFEESIKAYDKGVGKALYGKAALPQLAMLEAA